METSTVPSRNIAPARAPWLRDWVAMGLMIAAVVATYVPPRPTPETPQQAAADYFTLHARRMRFARDALLGARHVLPNWYPRELCGTPFWSNVQNFPFVPTRLLVLLTLDPYAPYTYAIATTLAAILAAGFTYLFCRRIKLGALAAATAGYTFVACGYFSARVAVGHLPLLEVYAALPALLWAVEALIQATERHSAIGRRVLVLALLTTCVMLGGHPQLPVYAIATAGLYALCRTRGALDMLWRPVAALALGVGCAGFALVPMAMLVGRSTRVLPDLERPFNDLPFAYRRLSGWLLPWLGQWLAPPTSARDVLGFAGGAEFWDTVCYAGWLPWIAIGTLACVALIGWRRKVRSRRTLRRSVGLFLIFMGIAGTVLALPAWQNVMSLIPGTYLRSPARLAYLTELAVAIGLAVFVERARNGTLCHGALHRAMRVIVPVLLAAHVAELWWFDRSFVARVPRPPQPTAAQVDELVRVVGDGRAGIDVEADVPVNREVDDLGFFDSIMLARPYTTFLELGGVPQGANWQDVSAAQLDRRALSAAGVRLLVTRAQLPSLGRAAPFGAYLVYMVPGVAKRAEFFPTAKLRFLESSALHAALVSRFENVSSVLLLPAEARSSPTPAPGSGSAQPRVLYARPGPDRIECDVTTNVPGYLRVIESWDIGWTASVNDQPAKIWPALDALLAVQLPAGQHHVVFEYRTPGARAGIIVSAASAAILLGLVVASRARRLRPSVPNLPAGSPVAPAPPR